MNFRAKLSRTILARTSLARTILARTSHLRTSLRRGFFSLRLLSYIYSLILYRFLRASFFATIRLSQAGARELQRRKRLTFRLALALFLCVFVASVERIVSSDLQAALAGSANFSLGEFVEGSAAEVRVEGSAAEISVAVSTAGNSGSEVFSEVLPENLSQDARPPAPPTRTSYRVIAHLVEGSLYQTAYSEGIPLELLRRFVDVMSFDVDFQRDIWTGAHFRLLVSQRFELGSGGLWREITEVLLETAELDTGSGKSYRYHRAAGGDEFYDETGKPAKRLLRRTPMSGLRLTSRFGARRHPILGYTRMHKGVDFAAPRGTPILAAGDGVVRERSYGSGYGRNIILRHNEHLSTLYAHMRSFARGVRVGTRVKQGATIGYVGTSGLSTGPHLHYEIHLDGRAVNPRTVRLPERQTLTATALSEFTKQRMMQSRLLAIGGDRILPSAKDRLRGLVWLSGMGVFSQNSAIASKP